MKIPFLSARAAEGPNGFFSLSLSSREKKNLLARKWKGKGTWEKQPLPFLLLSCSHPHGIFPGGIQSLEALGGWERGWLLVGN